METRKLNEQKPHAERNFAGTMAQIEARLRQREAEQRAAKSVSHHRPKYHNTTVTPSQNWYWHRTEAGEKVHESGIRVIWNNHGRQLV